MNARFNFVIPDDLLNRVKEIAESRDTSAAAIINEVLRNFVNNEDGLKALEKRVSELEKEVFKTK